MQSTYYNRRHRDVKYKLGYVLPLSNRNLRMKGVRENLKKILMGSFRLDQKIGQEAYRSPLKKGGENTLCFTFPY